MGINEAAARGLAFGKEILFTYGPLGYLTAPSAVASDHLVMHLLSFGLLSTTFAFILLRAQLAGGVSVPIGATVTWMVMTAVGALAAAEALALFAGGISLIALDDWSGRATRRWAAALSLWAPILFLSKPSAGLLAIGIAAVMWPSAHRRRGIAWLLAFPLLLMLTLAGAWTASGQALVDLPQWILGTYELVLGYQAMARPAPDFLFTVIAVILLVGTPCVFYLAHKRAAMSGPALIVAILMFVYAARIATVRQDMEHLATLALATLVIISALASHHPRPWTAPAVLLVATAFTAGLIPGGAVERLSAGPARFVDEFRMAISPDYRTSVLDEALAQVKADSQVPSDFLQEISGRTVTVDSYWTSIISAYRLNWDPVPVFHSYSAYTAQLDRRNARSIAASDAPDFVIRKDERAIDMRLQRFEVPQYTLALLCNYDLMEVRRPWQLLVRRTSQRCGDRVQISEFAIYPTQAVRVPAVTGQALVVMELEFERSPSQRVSSVLYPPSTSIEAIISDSRWRLTEGHAGGPLILRTIGDRSILDLGPDIESIAFDGDFVSVTVEFYRIELENPVPID